MTLDEINDIKDELRLAKILARHEHKANIYKDLKCMLDQFKCDPTTAKVLRCVTGLSNGNLFFFCNNNKDPRKKLYDLLFIKD